MKRLIVALTVSLLAGLVGAAEVKPLKVFILAGQSNMEGPASIKTFDYIGDDPKTAHVLKEMVGPDGKAVVCDHAYLSYLTGDENIELAFCKLWFHSVQVGDQRSWASVFKCSLDTRSLSLC
jgi:hypothetical protein